ncbi:MAG: hypothetical protein WED15_01805 [Akkermansiaceae bacterium]
MIGKTPNTTPSAMVQAIRSGEIPTVNCSMTGFNNQRRHQLFRASGIASPIKLFLQ